MDADEGILPMLTPWECRMSTKFDAARRHLLFTGASLAVAATVGVARPAPAPEFAGNECCSTTRHCSQQRTLCWRTSPMSEHQVVLNLAQRYLHGIYEGNVGDLREVFYPNARIEDTVTGSFRSRDVDQYLEAVASRQSPYASGEPFRMAPVSIGIWGDMATVTADLRFLGNHYVNVLSLVRCDGKWLITHKLFGSADK